MARGQSGAVGCCRVMRGTWASLARAVLVAPTRRESKASEGKPRGRAGGGEGGGR